MLSVPFRFRIILAYTVLPLCRIPLSSSSFPPSFFSQVFCQPFCNYFLLVQRDVEETFIEHLEFMTHVLRNTFVSHHNVDWCPLKRLIIADEFYLSEESILLIQSYLKATCFCTTCDVSLLDLPCTFVTLSMLSTAADFEVGALPLLPASSSESP